MPSNSERLNDILKRTTPLAEPLNEEDLLPDEAEPESLTIAQMDGKYTSMRPANKPLTRMHVITKDGKVRSYQFHFLDVESTFDGNSFTLIFVGTRHWQLTVKGHGPMLWRIYDYCTTHRWAYLREATGRMAGVSTDGETVLTEIKITDITPRHDE